MSVPVPLEYFISLPSLKPCAVEVMVPVAKSIVWALSIVVIAFPIAAPCTVHWYVRFAGAFAGTAKVILAPG